MNTLSKLYRQVKDKIKPPKRCKIKYAGKALFCWKIPCRMYVCEVCGSMSWDSRQGKNKDIISDLESDSRCSGVEQLDDGEFIPF